MNNSLFRNVFQFLFNAEPRKYWVHDLYFSMQLYLPKQGIKNTHAQRFQYIMHAYIFYIGKNYMPSIDLMIMYA